jgi:signal transduction histidine kinase/FixJ family two-component response regulator/HPt (histidine-containing phosphotransfer) domain-containing protein
MRPWSDRTRLVVFLAFAIAVTILGAAMLSIAQGRRVAAEETVKMGWRDSVAGVVFGFEREFSRFRGELAADARHPEDATLEDLQLRYELLVSRIQLLETTANLDVLRGAPQYSTLMERLGAIRARGDVLFAGPAPKTAGLVALLRLVDEATPGVQDFSRTASSAIGEVLEDQFDVLQQQAVAIVVLTLLQLVVLGAAAWLAFQHIRKQEATRASLEALAAQLQEAKHAADAANRTKSQFLANMSHELRTPFQGVIGMLQLLDQASPTPRQKDLIGTARDSANHLLALLNDVLDLSAIEEGRVVLERRTLDLHRSCREVHDLMRGQAAHRGLHLQTHIAPDVPQWVEGDVTRIKQVLFNLLSNAIKFTPAGRVTLDVSRGTGGTVRFAVTDTGIGMDEATLGRLFRRFEMGDESLSRRFGGAGLGLEISRNLARLMGGDILVTSRPGHGSRFKFSAALPACEAPEPAVVSAPAPLAGRPLRLLVADDHPVNRKYLGLVLENMGHTVALCEDGAQALAQIREETFDAALMDVHMPVMDGPAVTAAVRALGGSRRDLPILLITADVMSSTRDRAERSGVTAYLQKPVQAAQLAAALRAAVARTASGGEVSAVARGEALSSRFGQLAAELPIHRLDGLVSMFFRDESGTISGLQAMLASGDREGVGAMAHKLKGSAHLLGFRELAAVAEEIEQAVVDQARTADWDVLQARLAQALGDTRAAAMPRAH